MVYTYEEAMLDPGSLFKSPRDILDHEDFSDVQKRKILKAWELDITLLHICEEENMAIDGNIEMLRRIRQAMQTLSETRL